MRRKQPKTFHHFWAVDNTISDLAKLDPLPPPQRENLKEKKKKLILPDISILSISRSITLCCLSCPSLAPTVGLVSNRVNIPLKKKKKKRTVVTGFLKREKQLRAEIENTQTLDRQSEFGRKERNIRLVLA